jgi:Ca-activated chloride channel family protein
MNDGVAKTTLRQVFQNSNPMALEATYMFPLPDDAALNNFQLMMNGQMVSGEVLERDKAESIYTGIVRQQQDPALLEYMGRRLFRARIFPVPGSGSTEIRLSYDQVLPRDGRMVEYRYPFRTRSVTGAPVGKAVISVNMKSSTPMLTIYSPSHSVDIVKKGDHEARVSYEVSEDPGDRDFVLVQGLVAEGMIGATLFTKGEGEKGGAFLLLVSPSEELTSVAEVRKDVVFVVDTSGSMAGAKIEQAKRALSYCINRLNGEDRFNVITFSTESRMWSTSLKAVTSESRKAALEHVDGLVARGGTNINDALVAALSQSVEKDRPLMVIFVTDGEPTIGETRTDGILKNVASANKALTRLFVFGVGEDLKVDLLDALAEQNHGARDYVGGKEDLEVKVSSFYDKVASPVLTDVRVEFEGVAVSEMHPKPIPDLFRGSQLLLTGRYDKGGSTVISVRGMLNGKAVEHKFTRTFEDQGKRAEFVPRLWALRRVGYLMDQIRLNGEKSELKNEVVRLGKLYGIVSPYTSYLVVEDGLASDSRPAGPGGRRDGRSSPPGTWGGVRGGGNTNPQPAPGSSSSPELRGLTVAGAEVQLGAPDLPAEAAVRRLVQTPEASKSADDHRESARKKMELKDREALDRGYFRDAITLSQEIKNLRESQTGTGAGSGLVRRIGTRNFVSRGNLYVELVVLEADPKDLTAKLQRIEAYSDAYFALLKQHKELSDVLALGENLLFKLGDGYIQILPKAPPATEPAVPGK